MSQKSKKTAKKVYVTLVKDGKVLHKTYLQPAAKKEGILKQDSYAFLDSGLPEHPVAGGLICPHDGYSQRDFERSGRLGCPRCYETFSSLIQPHLHRMHKGLKHTGKLPKSNLNAESIKHRISQLEEQLEEVISKENFENAASIRDKINAYTQTLSDLKSK